MEKSESENEIGNAFWPAIWKASNGLANKRIYINKEKENKFKGYDMEVQCFKSADPMLMQNPTTHFSSYIFGTGFIPGYNSLTAQNKKRSYNNTNNNDNATRNNTNNTRINRTKITRKQKWQEKQFYGHFKRLTRDISRENLDVAKKGRKS